MTAVAKWKTDFLSKYTVDGNTAVEFGGAAKRSTKDVFVDSQGVSFNRGLYRLHNESRSAQWSSIVSVFFKFSPAVLHRVFGYDWLGRQFATVRRNESEAVHVFDYTRNEIFNLKCSFEEFHGVELVDFKETVLDASMFLDWIQLQRNSLGLEYCATPSIPIPLGGIIHVSNLEISDMEVAWELSRQIFEQVQN